MYGYVEWTDEVRRVTASEREILRQRFYCVKIPGKKGTPAFLLRRRSAAAAGKLQKAGVIRAVFPVEFPWMSEFAAMEIRPAEPWGLYRALAAELVQTRLAVCCQTGKQIPVAVYARRITEDVRRTVTDLCVRNRYVILSSPERDDMFCRRLRREFGVPLVQTEDPVQLSKAAVLLRFSGEVASQPGQEVIDLFPGGLPVSEVLMLAPELETRIPAGCDRLQMLAALYGGGILRPGQIQVMPSFAAKGAFDGEKA